MLTGISRRIAIARISMRASIHPLSMLSAATLLLIISLILSSFISGFVIDHSFSIWTAQLKRRCGAGGSLTPRLCGAARASGDLRLEPTLRFDFSVGLGSQK